MIIISHTEPGYSNQLFQNAFALAYAKENKRFFFNCSNVSWMRYYRGGNRFIVWLISILSKKRYKIPVLIQKILKIGHVNMNSYESQMKNILKLNYYKIVFISGWYFHIPLAQHREYFQKYYSLKRKYYKNNQTYKNIINLKENGYTIIGVHARRGDYKDYEGGSYFYDWGEYKKKIFEVKKNIQGKIKFIIFSNDVVPNALISDEVIISNEPWYLDHHLMGMCDFLFGPPSTFSLWASFIGGVKYCPLIKLNQKIDKSDFREYENPLC